MMDCPSPEPPEPTMVPPVPPHGSAGSDLESEDTGNTTFAGQVATVRNWLLANPTLTGTDIGTRLGKSDAYGRRLKRAAVEALASA